MMMQDLTGEGLDDDLIHSPISVPMWVWLPLLLLTFLGLVLALLLHLLYWLLYWFLYWYLYW